MTRKLAARLFEPHDCLFGPRLQEMHAANPEIAVANERVTRTEAYRVLVERNYIVNRADEKFAPAQCSYGLNPIAVGRDRCLVLGKSLLWPALGAQNLTVREVRERIARRCRQGSSDQLFGANNISSGGAAHAVEHAPRKRARQQALGLH